MKARGLTLLVFLLFAAFCTLQTSLLAQVPPPCATPPSGLVSWWKGESNTLDQVGGNNGSLAGHVVFGAAEVGQGFAFDGINEGVVIGDPTNLHLLDFTIEGWVARSNSGLVSPVTNQDALFFGYGAGGYGFGLDPAGRPMLTQIGVSRVDAPTVGLTDLGLHHVAVTKSGTAVTFYVDGVAEVAPAFGSMFSFRSAASIGSRGDTLGNVFLGSIDELSIYSRALSTAEVQSIYNAGSAGKCVPSGAPYIVTQPAAQTVTLGSMASFVVVAAGTAPLSYQWNFEGTNIIGATSSSLVISNAQLSDAGSYAVVVTNSAGIATSTIATLTVTLPPANVRVLNTTNMGGSSLVVPVVLVANGDENAVGFSLYFDPSQLTYTNTVLGNGATNATLLINSGQAAGGKIGIALALPTGESFGVGTYEIVEVSFIAATETNNISTAITFGDSPIGRQLADGPGNALPAVYTGGTVTLTATDFEADISPRPNGDRAVTITDWVLIGRFAAGLDSPTNASEFQRADCAPRATLGNGAITVSDWVQAGRYAAGLDPLTPAGGPTSRGPLASVTIRTRNPRQVIASSSLLMEGLPGTVTVSLQALGNENALGFSLFFDPTNLSYSGESLGSAVHGATLNVNTNQINIGRIGFALALATGSSFPAGLDELLKVTFKASPTAIGDLFIGFGDEPIYREVADPTAGTLSADYLSGTVTIHPPPSLRIQQAGSNVVLAWPAWATNFVLQQADGGYSASMTWSNLSVYPGITNNERRVTLQVGGTTRFYRLIQP